MINAIIFDELAKYNVCRSTINEIKLKRHWKHLTENLDRPITGRIYKRMSEQEIIEIFLDPRSQGQISKVYNIAQGNVSQIKNRKAYNHLTKNLIANSGKIIRL